MASSEEIIKVPEQYKSVRVVKVKVKRRQAVTPTTVVCTLETTGHPDIPIRCPGYGKVSMLCQEGSTLSSNDPLFKYEGCQHNVVMLDLCAECGANLRKDGGVCGERITAASASIPMVHMIPDLHVSESVAAEIALKDEESLLAQRKLALLIDLDQTVLHTTTTPNAFRYKNVHRFNLAGNEMVYHTRFRPHLTKFLRRMVKRFQMHICTFGNRAYAHQLASILDPKRKYFCQRILSRDECFNPVTKSANLKALFPRGVHLVCIIDDRGDVWDWSPNLIQVQPYRFFPEVGDINGPPGRPLSMMPMPDFRAFIPPSPTSTDTTNSSDEEGPSTSNVSKPQDIVAESKQASILPENAIVKSSEEETKAQQEPSSEFKMTSRHDIKEELKFSKSEGEINSEGPVGKPSSTDECESSTSPTQEESSNEEKVEKVVKKKIQYPPRCESPPPSHLPASSSPSSSSSSSSSPPPPSHPQSIFEMSEEALDAYDADYLLRLEDILMEIHRQYYRAYDKYMAELARNKALNKPVEYGSRLSGIPHVANVISSIRAKVLGPNTHITLSGLTPRNYPPSDSLAGRIALGLGARLHNRLRLPKAPIHTPASSSEHRSFTTHLVACRQNTEKVIAARAFQAQCGAVLQSNPLGAPETPIHIISPRWLWASYFRWQHLPESQFPLDQDFNVQAFDPDANPMIAAGHARLRRYQQSHHHHHCHHHHRRRYQRVRLLIEDEELRLRQELEAEEANSSKVQITPEAVLSALRSIEREERQERRRRHRRRYCHQGNNESSSSSSKKSRKRTLSESALGSASVSKRRCLRKSDSHLEAPASDVDNPRSQEEEFEEMETKVLPKSPSLSTTSTSDSEDDKEKVELEGQLPFASLPVESSESSSKSADDSDLMDNNMSIISDSDEDELASTASEEEDVESEDISEDDVNELDGPKMTDVEEDLKEEMKQYLPPPCPLEFAENPLLHMSPTAASEMIEEVEEAVMEEREERAASVPREMEQEESSSMSSNSTSSELCGGRKMGVGIGGNSFEDSEEEESGCLEIYDEEPQDYDRSGTRTETDAEENRLNIQIQLMIRRGVEGNQKNLARLRRRLYDITKKTSPRSTFPTDTNRVDRKQAQCRRRNLSHGLTSQVETDNCEFNTCPEGYDYADAEEARELLRPETVKEEVGLDASDDDDDEDEETDKKNPHRPKKKSKKGKKRILGAAGYLEASLFGSDISSSSNSDHDARDDGVVAIRSEALREFM